MAIARRSSARSIVLVSLSRSWPRSDRRSRRVSGWSGRRLSRRWRPSSPRSRSGVQRTSLMWQRATGSSQTGCQMPGGAVVPDLVRLLLPVLLAARLRQIERLILGADDDHLVTVAGRQHRGDVGGEWGVPTFVPGDQPAIDPDVGAVVDRAEMEHELPAAVVRRDLNGAPVPDDRVVPGVADAAGSRLRRKRDDHRPVEMDRPARTSTRPARRRRRHRQTPRDRRDRSSGRGQAEDAGGGRYRSSGSFSVRGLVGHRPWAIVVDGDRRCKRRRPRTSRSTQSVSPRAQCHPERRVDLVSLRFDSIDASRADIRRRRLVIDPQAKTSRRSAPTPLSGREDVVPRA